uniref:Uncharacterized protein n=1 Tax=Lactuca sativa TaxID=4236 RepID=A0A9R1VYG8_LACSA|nr:hypothetical protein LSAT_V11C400197400 [Lactuca sativa]
MDCWMLGSFHFTCASIKRFSLLSCPCMLVDVVHVTAPKLLFFSFYGETMHSLLFPHSIMEQIDFCLGLNIDRVTSEISVLWKNSAIWCVDSPSRDAIPHPD